MHSFYESAMPFYVKDLHILGCMGLWVWNRSSVDPHGQPHSHFILVSAIYWCIYLLGVTVQLLSGRSIHEMTLGVYLMPPRDLMTVKFWKEPQK